MAETGKEKQETYKDRQKKYMGQERMGGGVGGSTKWEEKVYQETSVFSVIEETTTQKQQTAFD